MYRISVPAFASSATFRPECVVEDLRKIGADRVFLAIDFLSNDQTVMDRYYDELSRAIPVFRDAGIEVGIWFWTFRFFSEEPKYTVMVNALGEPCHTTTVKYCPFDEGYLSFMEEHVRRLAALRPDLILFDDDLAFGFTSMRAPACFCELHRRRMGELLGEDTPPIEGLYERIFGGAKNRYRSAFMQALRESLENFVIRMRRAVDSIDPTVRMGACGCITTFDYDGIDSFRLVKLLAGNTKPFLRLIGAPYWASVKLHGNELCDVIELERMARAWYPDDDIEIVSEGDTYPRPRHRVPASYLELFDAALRADGNMDGILKYVLCYSNHADYERGYINAHLCDERDLNAIREAFSGLSDCGVRVYETMHKIEDSDYSNDVLTVDLIRYQFFSHAARYLAHASIPTAYRGRGCAGIVFGENARALDREALEKPLILDEHAARILQEKGIDVGIVSFGPRFTPTQEYYPSTDEYETVTDYGHRPAFASTVVPNEKAVVESAWITPSGERLPASFSYKNADGNQFLVLCQNAFTAAEEIYKNYSRQRQFFSFLEQSGAQPPVRTLGNPELYVLCKEGGDTLAVALFNSFADAIDGLDLTLSEDWRGATCYRASGELFNAQTLHIHHLSAFDWCFVLLKK